MNHSYLPDAQEEVFSAAAFYDQQRRGLGNEFLDEIEQALKKIFERPKTWPRHPVERAVVDYDGSPTGLFMKRMRTR